MSYLEQEISTIVIAGEQAEYIVLPTVVLLEALALASFAQVEELCLVLIRVAEAEGVLDFLGPRCPLNVVELL